MRRKIKLSRGDTLGGTVPLILPGKLTLDPGQARFGRRRRPANWPLRLFGFAVIGLLLFLAFRVIANFLGIFEG